ncbi:hypothetical protein GALMADRAFT_768318 [Galerina marginata CBS 339.88]|uniref:Uncharacterized protein n=1 Tax=Galerina marginata (strain CBS 339.88) TaxID=685588 RepID=A0A067SX60_GALM3|nr:hypothetical protein GALMADRAFT_768318 [Galerina marginata CBS 339.88]
MMTVLNTSFSRYSRHSESRIGVNGWARPRPRPRASMPPRRRRDEGHLWSGKRRLNGRASEGRQCITLSSPPQWAAIGSAGRCQPDFSSTAVRISISSLPTTIAFKLRPEASRLDNLAHPFPPLRTPIFSSTWVIIIAQCHCLHLKSKINVSYTWHCSWIDSNSNLRSDGHRRTARPMAEFRQRAFCYLEFKTFSKFRPSNEDGFWESLSLILQVQLLQHRADRLLQKSPSCLLPTTKTGLEENR